MKILVATTLLLLDAEADPRVLTGVDMAAILSRNGFFRAWKISCSDLEAELRWAAPLLGVYGLYIRPRPSMWCHIGIEEALA